MVSDTPSPPTGLAFRVAIDTVWLEFMIDGEGNYFVHAHGQVIEAAQERLKPVRAVELKLGNYDALGTGLHVLGSAASAAIIKDETQIEAIKALVARATEPDTHLIADITAEGLGLARANGQAHSWAVCDAQIEVLNDAAPPPPDGECVDPEDAANIRAELALVGAPTGLPTSDPITLSGAVTTVSGVDIADFDHLTLHLDPSANKGLLRLDANRAELTWPTPVSDMSHILAMLEHARQAGRLLLDIDLGARPLDDEARVWPVTDVSLLVKVLV